MDNINFPRIDSTTAEGKIAQIINFLFVFVRDHNIQVQELERQINDLRGDNNGEV